jgi:phosphoribosylaminoimidazole-succinocarboxamide synthase
MEVVMDKSKGRFLRSGSSKDIYHMMIAGNDYILMDFTDGFSVFDRGRAPWNIAGLGELRKAIASRCLRYMSSYGVKTHFLEDFDKSSIIVKAAAIPELDQKISLHGRRVLGVEVLWRNTVTEKFVGRVKSKKVTLDRFFLKDTQPLLPGAHFEDIFVECSTKFEETDRYLSDHEASLIARISPDALQDMYAFARRASQELSELFGPELVLMTGKFEIILTDDQKFEIADSISPDELEIEGGFDKNILRDWYKINHPDWIEALKLAKCQYPNDKSAWPEYPAPPPQEIMKKIVDSYTHVANVIGC